MDAKKIEKDGIKPLNPEFEKVNNIKNTNDIAKMIAHQHKIGAAPVFYFYASQDEKNSDMIIANVYQGGLGLPDRYYYTSPDENSAMIRAKYVEHVEKMFKLMGVSSDNAKANAQTVMNLETRLANASHTRLEQRDPNMNYNKMKVSDVKKLSPNFAWDIYFSEIGLAKPGDVNVCQTKFLAEADKMINEVSIEDWKTYFRWNLINSFASYLSSDFEKQNFDFYGKTLSGKTKDRDRWKKALSATSGSLGELVGQVYVKKYFPAQSKEKMLNLVNNLKIALGERIQNLQWMGPDTKKEALAKLKKMNVKIGYPDKWRDYSGLEIKKDSYVANVIRANEFDFDFNLKKINKPVDRTAKPTTCAGTVRPCSVMISTAESTGAARSMARIVKPRTLSTWPRAALGEMEGSWSMYCCNSVMKVTR
jgi:putative endopeptidase